MEKEDARLVRTDLKRRLSIEVELAQGYLAALFLIAVTIITGGILLHNTMVRTDHQGEVLNIAGGQRMLSQRIVALTYRYESAATESERSAVLMTLLPAQAAMRQNHAILTKKRGQFDAPVNDSRALQEHYGPSGARLSRNVGRFLDEVQAFVQTPDAFDATRLEALREHAMFGLMRDLDFAVTLHQQAVASNNRKAESIHLAVIALAMFLLVAEALLIFRPMAAKAAGRLESAETELKTRSELLSRSLTVANMGYWFFERKTPHRIWISDELAALYQLGEGQRWVSLALLKSMVSDDDSQLLGEAIARCIASGEPESVRTVVTTPTARQMHIATRVTAEFDADGNATTLTGVVQDVTAEFAAKEQLQNSYQLLSARTQALQEAQQLGQSCSWRFARGSTTIEISDDGYRLLGYEPGAFTPDLAGLKTINVDDAYFRVIESQRLAMETDKVQAVDVSVRRADGTIADVTLRTKVERDAAGRPLALVGTVQDITERRHAERQLEQLAYYDHLTGLANRVLCARKLKDLCKRASESGDLAALVLIDLDNFKEINDTLGHEAGDDFLCEVARRLTQMIGKGNVAARLGGDEFALLLRDAGSNEAVLALVSQMLEVIAEVTHLAQGQVTGAASAGVCLIPTSTSDPDEALRFADLALYAAKEQGRNRALCFEPAMSDTMLERLSLARDLRDAVEKDQLETHYQPIIALGDGGVIGFEALLRWKHETRGWVSPAEFIPIAESSHLISDLGAFVLRDACRTLRNWMDAGMPPRSVSVNVSVAQLWQNDLVAMVDELLDEYRLPAELLCIELTESVFVGDAVARIEGILRALKARGVRISLDDFGTGYSSLGYLNRMPFDVLKVDRCFVMGADQSPEKLRLLEGIVGLARGLGMSVTAEGVETAAELAVVRRMGCDRVQGFYFGRAQDPVSAIEQAARIEAEHKLAPIVDAAINRFSVDRPDRECSEYLEKIAPAPFRRIA